MNPFQHNFSLVERPRNIVTLYFPEKRNDFWINLFKGIDLDVQVKENRDNLSYPILRDGSKLYHNEEGIINYVLGRCKELSPDQKRVVSYVLNRYYEHYWQL